MTKEDKKLLAEGAKEIRKAKAEKTAAKPVTDAKVGTLAIHPLAQLFPMLQSKEYKELAADIAVRGIVVPILVNKKKDTIIDGRNRYWIALENGMAEKDIPKEVFDGTDEDIPKEILSRNLFRRHLTDKQRVVLVTKLRAPQLEKEAKERMGAAAAKKGTFNGKGVKGTTVAKEIAKESKTTEGRAKQALAARKAGLLDEVYAEKRSLKSAADAAPKRKSKKAAAAPKKLEDVVWARFQRWIKYWPMQKHQEVKVIVAEFCKV
jgi:ParB-like chromosome segregation protein Spo0J